MEENQRKQIRGFFSKFLQHTLRMVQQSPFAKVLLKQSQKSKQEIDYSKLPQLSRSVDNQIRHSSVVGMKILSQLTQEVEESQRNKILGFFSKFTEKLVQMRE